MSQRLLLALVELLISLRAGEQHVYPDGHGLWRGRHQKVGPVKGLHAEGQFGAGALDRLQVVSIDLLDRLKTHGALELELGFVREVIHLVRGEGGGGGGGGGVSLPSQKVMARIYNACK